MAKEKTVPKETKETVEQPARQLVAVMASGIRIHAAERNQSKTLCGKDVTSVGMAARMTGGVTCGLCLKSAGDEKIVRRPRRESTSAAI